MQNGILGYIDRTSNCIREGAFDLPSLTIPSFVKPQVKIEELLIKNGIQRATVLNHTDNTLSWPANGCRLAPKIGPNYIGLLWIFGIAWNFGNSTPHPHVWSVVLLKWFLDRSLIAIHFSRQCSELFVPKSANASKPDPQKSHSIPSDYLTSSKL